MQRRVYAAGFNQRFQRDWRAGEFADGKQRAIHRQRRQHRVDAAAVCQTGIDHGRAFIHPPTDGGNDAGDDARQMPLILEAHRCRLKHAMAFHEHLPVGVDQNIGNGGVLQQRL